MPSSKQSPGTGNGELQEKQVKQEVGWWGRGGIVVLQTHLFVTTFNNMHTFFFC